MESNHLSKLDQVTVICRYTSNSTQIYFHARIIHDNEHGITFEWPIGSHRRWFHYKTLYWFWQLGIEFEKHVNQPFETVSSQVAIEKLENFVWHHQVSPTNIDLEPWTIYVQTNNHVFLPLDLTYHYPCKLIKSVEEQQSSNPIMTNSYHHINMLWTIITHVEKYPHQFFNLCYHRYAKLANYRWIKDNLERMNVVEARIEFIDAFLQKWQDDERISAGGQMITQLQSAPCWDAKLVYELGAVYSLDQQSFFHPMQGIDVDITNIDSKMAHDLIRTKKNSVIPFRGMRTELKQLCAKKSIQWRMPYILPRSSIHGRLVIDRYKEWYPGSDDERVLMYRGGNCHQCHTCFSNQTQPDGKYPIETCPLPSATRPNSIIKDDSNIDKMILYHGISCSVCSTRTCWSCTIKLLFQKSIEVMSSHGHLIDCYACPCSNVIIPWDRIWPIANHIETKDLTWIHTNVTRDYWLTIILPIIIANMMNWKRYMNNPVHFNLSSSMIDDIQNDVKIIVWICRPKLCGPLNRHDVVHITNGIISSKIELDDNNKHVLTDIDVNHMNLVKETLFQSNIQAWLMTDACPRCGTETHSIHHPKPQSNSELMTIGRESSNLEDYSFNETTLVMCRQCPQCFTSFCVACRKIFNNVDESPNDHCKWNWSDYEKFSEHLKKRWNGSLSILRSIRGSCCFNKSATFMKQHIQLIKKTFIDRTWIVQHQENHRN